MAKLGAKVSEQTKQAANLFRAGNMTLKNAAKATGIHWITLWRYLKKQKEQKGA